MDNQTIATTIDQERAKVDFEYFAEHCCGNRLNKAQIEYAKFLQKARREGKYIYLSRPVGNNMFFQAAHIAEYMSENNELMLAYGVCQYRDMFFKHYEEPMKNAGIKMTKVDDNKIKFERVDKIDEYLSNKFERAYAYAKVVEKQADQTKFDRVLSTLVQVHKELLRANFEHPHPFYRKRLYVLAKKIPQFRTSNQEQL